MSVARNVESMGATDEIAVTRLALFDRRAKVFGYELRPASRLPKHAVPSSYLASLASHVARVTERDGLGPFTGTRPAFITVDEQFLRSGEYRRLPAGQTYLVFASDEVSTFESEVAELDSVFHSARRDGYRIGLDGVTDRTFGIGTLPKVDFVTMLGATDSLRATESLADVARKAGVLTCARLVRSPGQFAQLQSHFDLFQGFFYQRKVAGDGQGISTGRLATLQLLTECANPDATLEMFESIIGRDPALTFRVMQLANSGFTSLSRRLSSLRDALITVGVSNIRNLAMIASLNRLEDSQQELLVNSLVRAKMCEVLSRPCGLVPSTAFTAGLLSMLDAFLGLSLTEAVELASLSDELRSAIVSYEGILGRLVATSIAYEQAEYVSPPVQTLSSVDVSDAYLRAVAWVHDLGPMGTS